jgi:hypothetical protein
MLHSGDDVSPSLACGRGADEPKRGGEVNDYQVEQIVRDVVNASRRGLLNDPVAGSSHGFSN